MSSYHTTQKGDEICVPEMSVFWCAVSDLRYVLLIRIECVFLLKELNAVFR